MQTLFRAIDKGIDRVLSVTGRVTSVLLVLIAFFVFANVVSRFVGFPLPWLFDVTCFCLIIFTYLGAAYGLREGTQINVDILRNHLSEETNAFLDIFIYILSAGFFCILGWTGWEWAHDSFVFGLRTTTAVIKFPKWIIISFIPLGSFLPLVAVYPIGHQQHSSPIEARAPRSFPRIDTQAFGRFLRFVSRSCARCDILHLCASPCRHVLLSPDFSLCRDACCICIGNDGLSGNILFVWCITSSHRFR